MRTYTICFITSGGLTIEAETEEEALDYLESEEGQEAIGMCLSGNDITVTDIICEDWEEDATP